MPKHKKTLAEKLAEEARRQYEEGKKKETAASAEALMAEVQAKLDARKSEAEKAAEAAVKNTAKAQASAESLMAEVQAKLDARKTDAEKAAEAAAKQAAEAQANAESLMAGVAAKLQAQQPKVKPSSKKEEPEIYEVQPGDSLSKIAKEVYGDMSRWPEIYEANKDTIKDPNIILVGQKLVIPRK